MAPRFDLPVSIDRQDPGFPAGVARVPRPPSALWVWGSQPPVGPAVAPAIAIVGSRAASGAGCAIARALAADLVRAGHGVVSGGAFGIDAAAHEGAIAAGGPTWAVLGCGVDVVYPDRHAALFAAVRGAGALLSEHPPGTPPRRRQFPARNRLIVGLARAVIVVEAAPRSGALVTARLARAQGRPLLAVPGSPGTDELLGRGHAVGVADAGDVLRVLAGGPGLARPAAAPASGPLAALVAAVGEGHATPAALALVLGLPLSRVLALCSEAELEGLVVRRDGALEVPEVRRGR